MNVGSKAAMTLQQCQLESETGCVEDDLKEIGSAHIGVDESVLRELLRLGLSGQDIDESFLIADDPEIRKAARRMKIERRIKQSQTPLEEGELPVKIFTSSDSQMEESIIRILELLENSRRSITNVRAACFRNELERLKKEKERRDEIDNLITDECNKAQSTFMEISTKWREIGETDNILKLESETKREKDRCQELLESKDIMIANLKIRLKQAERQFNEELAKQDNYLNVLNERIDSQIDIMDDYYRKELQHLQNAVNVEKTEVMNERKKQWEKMAGKKEELELNNMVKRYDYLQECEDQMDSMAIEQHETMRDQKMIMENKLNKLTVEENRYESAVLISKELLNYNVQVLQKRQDENRVIKAQQKRIVNRLQDTVRKLQKQQKDYIAGLYVEKKRLQGKIAMLNHNVITLNDRLRSVAISRNKKYFQLWDFNQGAVEDLVHKLIEADKKFYTSLLCVPWHFPAVEFSRKNLPSYIEAKAMIKEKKGKLPNDSSLPTIEKQDMQKLIGLVLDSVKNKTEFLIDDTLKVLLEPLSSDSKALITIDTLLNALGMQETDDIERMSRFFLPYIVCEKCGQVDRSENNAGGLTRLTEYGLPSPMIVAERIKKQFANTNDVIKDEFCAKGAILNLVTGDDEMVIKENDPREEAILRKHEILGFQVDPSQLPILAKVTPSKICDVDTKEGRSANKTDGDNKKPLVCNKPGHHPAINPTRVTKALNEFVIAATEERKSIELASLKKMLTQTIVTESRHMSKVDVDAFWKEFGNMFSKKKKLIWKSLLTEMKVNYTILFRRHNLNENVSKLRQRNQELKKFLSNYLLEEKNKTQTDSVLSRLSSFMDVSDDSIPSCD